MPSEEKPRHLRLHFEGPLTRDHSLPASVLVQALQQVQRIVHLLAMTEEGREVRQRARVTREIERRFPLVCGVPEDGGFALPVVIGDTSHHFFDPQIVDRVAQTTHKVIRAVNVGDKDQLVTLVPDSYYRHGILAAFSAMQPRRQSGVIVSIEDFREQKLLDGRAARARIEELFARPESITAGELGYVTGALIEMKFQERRLRLKLVVSGRALDANYSDDFEPVLLENPRELIQVHGNVVYGEDGSPMSISDVDEILEVDDSPIEVLSVDFDHHTLRPISPLSFQVRFDPEVQLYEIQGKFGIQSCAETRPELEAQVYAELAMLWQEYALAEAESLTTAARQLQSDLLAVFEDVNNAS